jgi:hypothetical protein
MAARALPPLRPGGRGPLPRQLAGPHFCSWPPGLPPPALAPTPSPCCGVKGCLEWRGGLRGCGGSGGGPASDTSVRGPTVRWGASAAKQPFAARGKQNPSERSERPEGGGSSALHGPPTEGGFGEPLDRRKGAAGDMATVGPQMPHLGKSACPRQVDGGLEWVLSYFIIYMERSACHRKE